jgi:hypothetical protein
MVALSRRNKVAVRADVRSGTKSLTIRRMCSHVPEDILEPDQSCDNALKRRRVGSFFLVGLVFPPLLALAYWRSSPGVRIIHRSMLLLAGVLTMLVTGADLVHRMHEVSSGGTCTLASSKTAASS